MHILLTNDDGLKAPGLQTLKRELASHDCRLTVVAPNGQRSAASHSMTINKALYCRDESTVPGIREIAVSGTPVTASRWPWNTSSKTTSRTSSFRHQRRLQPGSDVLYSGTVSAAMEGPYYGLPAFAVSMLGMTEERCVQTAHLVWDLVQKLIVKGRFPGIVNVNVPPEGDISLDNVRVVPQTVQIYHNVIAEKRDLDGSVCYHIVGDIDMTTAPEDSDVACIRQGHIALTPLKWQQTADRVIDHLKGCLSV